MEVYGFEVPSYWLQVSERAEGSEVPRMCRGKPLPQEGAGGRSLAGG